MAKNDSSITTLDDAPKNVEPAPAVPVVKITGSADALSGDMIELTIGQGEGDIGKQPVFVQVNDGNMLIPRGVPCVVPVEFAEVIQNAQMVVSESMGLVKNEREVARFSYQTRAVRNPAAAAA